MKDQVEQFAAQRKIWEQEKCKNKAMVFEHKYTILHKGALVKTNNTSTSNGKNTVRTGNIKTTYRRLHIW